MLNPNCTDQLNQIILTKVDTLGELYSLTCLASTPHQSALKYMPYNGLLVVVAWVLLEGSACVLLTTLV